MVTFCFRPLTGILFFNFARPARKPPPPPLSFRPLTGILFFNGEEKTMKVIEEKEFPSPYGDFVFQRHGVRSVKSCCLRFRPLTGILFFNTACFLSFLIPTSSFPSPYGDFVFQRMEKRCYSVCFRNVSVPLRGFCFSTKKMKVWRSQHLNSFRPLTGILFFNLDIITMKKNRLSLVSVPLRGFCFSTPVGRPTRRTARWGFRPLTGILFFN